MKRPRRISEVIKNKHVGLYVCCDGELIPLLHDLHEQCKVKDEKFEIVVLYLPLISMIDPDAFKEKIDGCLRKQKICGWWCLPFNNSVNMPIWDLTKHYHCFLLDIPSLAVWEDKMIIMGPDGKILDMYGGHVIKEYRIDVHPFTRAAIVEKRMRQLRDLRLESLLVGQLFRGSNPNDVISAATLLSSKKKIIIYMDSPRDNDVNGVIYDFEGLVSQYYEMKKVIEFEVVFVQYPAKKRIPEVEDDKFSAMPWYIHRRLDGTYTPLAEKLEETFFIESLVGFGEDGHIYFGF